MDFYDLLKDALSYTWEGVVLNMKHWAALILAVICLGIPMNGYTVRIFRGTDAAPDVDRWGTLFIDGIKLLIVGLIYAIPVLIVWGLIYGSMFLAAAAGNFGAFEQDPNMALLLLLYIVEIAVAIITPIAYIRFARTGSIARAFDLGAIIATIQKIGWINYLLALVIVALVIGVPIFLLVFGTIIISGAALYVFFGGRIELLFAIAGLLILLMLIISPPISVFQSRYLTRVYESAEPAE
jgi:hypothetical protein